MTKLNFYPSYEEG